MRYKFDSIHQKALMIASADVKSEIKAKFKSDIPSIRIGYIPFEGIGAIELKAFINVDGEISIGYNNHVEFGVVYEDSMFKLHRTFTNNKQPSLAAAFSVNAGVELLASLDKSIPFISASASVKTGILNKVQIDEYSDNKTPFVCQHRFSFLYATAETSATVDFKVVKKSLVDKKWEIWGPDNTPAKSVMHIEDGQLVPQCTRNPHKYDNFFSKWNSWYGGYGWYGLDDAGEIVPVFTYTLDDEGNATITGYTGRASILDIPEEVDGHPVVAIGKNAFKNRTDLLCVSIPDGVLNIKDDAFYGCTNLSSVNLPKSLVDIGSRVFYNDNNITSIEIPKSLSKAAEYNHDGPFGKCNGLKYISFEEGVSKIAKCLFAGCDGIEEIVIPDTVTTIEDNAFLECEHLLKIKIPSKVTSIGDYAFQGCVSLAEVLFDESLTTIGSRAFAGDSMLREIIITDSVTEIKNGAFAKCDNLNKVVLSKQLKTIGAEAFYNDDKITEIIVPKSLENTTDVIQQYAYRDGFQSMRNTYLGPFYECDGLKNVTFESGTTAIATGLFAHVPGLEEIEIPDTVTAIKYQAFYDCKNLNNVKISSSTTVIEESSFAYDINLKNIVIPDSVTEIKKGAFAKCKNLSNVVLSKRLTILGAEVFYDDDSIETIKIPKTLTTTKDTIQTYAYGDGYESMSSVYKGSFYNCSGLKKVIFENGITNIPDCLFRRCDGLEDVSIPDSVISIEGSVFADCTSLKEIVLPDTINSMGTYVFSGCTNLKKVHIPNIRINMMEGTFNNCKSLENINFPDTLETIQGSAFKNCTSLKEVVLPGKVKTIEGSAFSGCTALTKVVIPDSVRTINGSAFSHCEVLTDLSIAEGVTEIKGNAFEYNKALQKVTLPDSLNKLGDKAFQYCDSLSEVDMGAGIKVVPKYCFYEDPALTSIILPQQMTAVNDYAFGNCTKFEDITMNRNVSSVVANAFSYPDKLTIHGISGTYAENFANDNSITFKAINSPATSVKLNHTKYNLAKNATLQMTAAITPVDSTDELTWISSNEEIATVDEKTGLVKAIDVGNTEIIAMIGDKTAICELIVYRGVTGVDLNVTSKELGVGDTLQLIANISPSDATNKNVIWRSSEETVAEIDDNGLVTALSLGTADITVKTEDGEYEKTCSITVKEVAVTGVTLNTKTATIGIGKTYKLIPTIEPQNAANKEVTWTSSKLDVATVENGIVTGIAEGQTTIIVKTVDGSKTATCMITVSKDAPDNPEENGDNPDIDEPGIGDAPSDNPADRPGTGEQGDNSGGEQGESGEQGGNDAPGGSDTPGGNDNQGGNGNQNQNGTVPSGSQQPSTTPVTPSQQTQPSNQSGQQQTIIQPQTQTNPDTQTVSTNTEQPTGVVDSNTLAGVKRFSVKNKKGRKLVLSWKWQDGVDKYEIQYALNKKFTKSKKSKKAAGYLDSLTIKKLKKGKTYYVRIRAFSNDNGKKLYSEWSKVKKVKIKK